MEKKRKLQTKSTSLTPLSGCACAFERSHTAQHQGSFPHMTTQLNFRTCCITKTCFPFGVVGAMWNLIGSIDHCLFRLTFLSRKGKADKYSWSQSSACSVILCKGTLHLTLTSGEVTAVGAGLRSESCVRASARLHNFRGDGS